VWRDAVDDHDLLFPHYFPRDVFPGIFTQNFGSEDKSSFFAPPAPRSGWPRGARDRPVFRHPVFRFDWAQVRHHCNGLLLLENENYRCHYVCNPATVRCTHLPEPSEEYHYDMSMFLAFDPAVSLHYEVFFLPRPEKQKEIHAGDMESKDKVISISVFSYVKIWKTAEYWQGFLYVHCWNDIIMIIHNSEGVYDMAQLPSKAYDDSEYGCISKLPKRTILASYEKGVHYVALDRFQLHVWTLAQSDDGKVRWVLAHELTLVLIIILE
jgi:hypothetical protein